MLLKKFIQDKYWKRYWINTFLFYLFLLLILNFFSSKFLSFNYNLKAIKTNDLIEYKKLYKKVNHLRNPLQFPKSEIFFTQFINNTSKTITKKTVIIQGDSWIEDLIIFNSTRKILEKFSQTENIDIIVAGVSSYSPSLYHAQYNILRDIYKFKPDQLIVMIDQTDLGDELCRYKNVRKFENKKLIVKNYDLNDTNILYNLDDVFQRVLILNSDSFSMVKLLKLSIIKIKEQFFSKYFYKRREEDCTFDKIIKPLVTSINKEDYNYFNLIVKDYVSEIKKETKIINILMHPHRNHLLGLYQNKISNILDMAFLEKEFQVNFYEFEPNLDNIIIEKIYKKGDIASHPTEEWYRNVILPKILEIINLN